MMRTTSIKPAPARRGFTLVEVIIAAVVTAFVVGAIWASLGRMIDTRATARARMHAYLRADMALDAVRRDIAAVLRSDDLYWTKFRIDDGATTWSGRLVPRDELLLFSNRLDASRPLDWQGEGIEFETQYRIVVDSEGPALWQRRDKVPDEYYDAGGVATPIADGIVGLDLLVYDGAEWRSYWDSDYDGLPLSVLITVMVPIEDKPESPLVVLRTEVAIDRVAPPFDSDDEDDDDTEGEGGSGQEGGAGDGGETGSGGGGGRITPTFDGQRPRGRPGGQGGDDGGRRGTDTPRGGDRRGGTGPGGRDN